MAETINILNVRNAISDGGVEKTLLNWSISLDHNKFNWSLACFSNRGRERCLVEPARAHKIPTYLLPWGPRRPVISAVRELVRLVREHDVHILHSHDVLSNLVSYFAARKTGVPLMGGAYAWFGKSSYLRLRVLEWLDVRLMKSFAGVIAVSESLRKETIARGIDASKVVTVYPGVDYQDLQRQPNRLAIRRRFGFEAEDIVIANLARVYPEKGQCYLIEAMSKVIPHFPRAKLMIIGNGPIEGRLKEQCRALGISQSVVFAGFPPDLPDVLPIIDLQVHSSIYEGLPMAVLQGMAAGIPVVATDVGGLSEVVTPGITGLLVQPRNSERLAESMLSLLRNREEARLMGSAGQRLIREHLQVSRVIRTLETVYTNVYGQRSAAVLEEVLA